MRFKTGCWLQHVSQFHCSAKDLNPVDSVSIKCQVTMVTEYATHMDDGHRELLSYLCCKLKTEIKMWGMLTVMTND